MSTDVIIVDVREDIRSGLEPCSKIMAAASELPQGYKLLLIAPFEPVPLFGVMAARGFSHEARPLDNGDWEVLFSRSSDIPISSAYEVESQPRQSPRASFNQVLDIDARGLEPPEPLMRVLQALADLNEGDELRARTDRKPIHLLPLLAERGFATEIEEQLDGSFVTRIHHG